VELCYTLDNIIILVSARAVSSQEALNGSKSKELLPQGQGTEEKGQSQGSYKEVTSIGFIGQLAQEEK